MPVAGPGDANTEPLFRQLAILVERAFKVQASVIMLPPLRGRSSAARRGPLSGAAKPEPGFTRERNIILRSLLATPGEALLRLKFLGGQILLFECSTEFFGLSEIST